MGFIYFKNRLLNERGVHWSLHLNMPRKIRELIWDLEKAGWANRGGKGSQGNFTKSGRKEENNDLRAR
jgi:hypothetical protein